MKSKNGKAKLFLELQSHNKPNFGEQLVSILETSAQVFAREGYEKSSMRTISRATKLSLGTLYYYVKSKEEILFLIQYHTFNYLIQTFKEKLNQDHEPEDRLETFVANHLEHFAENVGELKVCARELETLKGEYYQKVKELRRQYFELAHKVVSDLKKKNRSSLDPWLATAHLFGMLNWFYQWYNPQGKKISRSRLVQEQVRLFTQAFQTAPATV